MAISAPTDIAGCQLWLDAKEPGSIDLPNGASVPLWSDLSGTGHHVTQANPALQPVFQRKVINGNPSIHFYGEANNPWNGTQGPAENYLQNLSFVDFNAAGTFTFFMVARLEKTDVLAGAGPATQHQCAWEVEGGAFNSGPNFLHFDQAGRITATADMRLPNSGSFREVPEAADASNLLTWAGGFRSYSGKWDAPSGFIYRDGVQVGTVSGPANSGGYVTNHLFVGDLPGRYQPMSGYMSLLIMYDTALSDPDRLDVEDWIQARWFSDDQHRRSVGSEVPN